MRVTDEFVFFWGNKDIYSNFLYSPFRHNGIMFKWSEQAIMYRKAMHFGANVVAQKILRAQTPKECKDLGRSRAIQFVQEEWENVREQIYKEVLLDKFSNPKLKVQILATENKILVEASPFDAIWGIKMDAYHPDVEDPSRWKGLNLLGKVLMEVRSELGE